MAETNTRREARRRNILENSESRLRRIITRNADEFEETYDSVKEKSSLAEHNVRNGICVVNNEEKSQNHILNDNAHEKFFDNINITTEIMEDMSSKYKKETNNIDKAIHSSEEVSKMEYKLYILLASRMNLILLAGIVNILLILQLDSWFGQTITIPYLLTMLGRLYYWKKFYKAQNNSLLVAALLLCNIKSNLIYTLKVSLSLFNIIVSDFCLYMFSFILLHYAITFVTTISIYQ